MMVTNPDLPAEGSAAFHVLCEQLAEHYFHMGGDDPEGLLRRPPIEHYKKAIPELVKSGVMTIVMRDDGSFRLEATEKGIREAQASRDLVRWFNAGLRPERAAGTRMHEFVQAARSDDLVNAQMEDSLRAIVDGTVGIFVVEHDWAGAFAEADIGEVTERKLPFPQCCFELGISGRRVCAFLDEDIGAMVAGVSTDAGWVLLNSEIGFLQLVGLDVNAVQEIVQSQVDAILVALDSGVATTEVIRAPEKLNRARIRRRKPPINDYHAVKLARPSRPEPLPAPAGNERARTRLHFRRGHWRQLQTHKVWINWTLVGDPDLGFIDKHYRL
jgi:hypothetical protein